jgi:hypothetical protein
MVMDSNTSPYENNSQQSPKPAPLRSMRPEPEFGRPVTMGGAHLNESIEKRRAAEEEKLTQEKNRKRTALNVATVRPESNSAVQDNASAQATVTEKMHKAIKHQREVQESAGNVDDFLELASVIHTLHGFELNPLHDLAENLIEGEHKNEQKSKNTTKPMRPSPNGDNQ